MFEHLISSKIRQWALPLLFICQLNCLLAQDADKSKTDEVKAPFFGRVVDTDGNPVTDAKISLQGPSYLQTETDEQGKFWFLDAKEAGEYRLRIESSKWVGITDFRKTPQIIIDPDQPTEKQFTLERACQVELTVVDEKGEPVKAAVYYKPLAGEQFGNASNSATNAAGVALVGGLDPSLGKYSVVASSSAHAPSQVIVSTDDRNVIQKHKLVLAQGKSIKGKPSVPMVNRQQVGIFWHFQVGGILASIPPVRRLRRMVHLNCSTSAMRLSMSLFPFRSAMGCQLRAVF